jgi:O-ureido-D-serine cyclo-ligase
LVSALVVTYDDDMPVLVDALRDAGVEAAVESWDDPDVDWAAYRLAVIRSTWDYVMRRDEFLGWLARASTCVELHNPRSVVAANTDKHYLLDLAALGLSVVPTEVFEPGSPPADRVLPDWEGDLVVKPAVGAGSRGVGRFADRGLAHEHLSALLREDRAALVQPYLAAVDTAGETGMVYFDGEFSHAFRKGAILAADAEPSTEVVGPASIAACAPTADERTVADAVVAACAADLLYARVDLIADDRGIPRVAELELSEPSFFFETSPDAPARFAQAIALRLETVQ